MRLVRAQKQLSDAYVQLAGVVQELQTALEKLQSEHVRLRGRFYASKELLAAAPPSTREERRKAALAAFAQGRPPPQEH